MTEMPTSNGAGNHRGTVAPTPALKPGRCRRDRPETIIAAVDLLAHYWSRPLSDEVGTWVEARELEAETDVRSRRTSCARPSECRASRTCPSCSRSTSACS